MLSRNQAQNQTAPCRIAIDALHAQLKRESASIAHTSAAEPIRVIIDPNDGQTSPGVYPQLGYLKSHGKSALPLYGVRSSSRKGRGFYYTIVPGTSIKVPIHTSGTKARDCMDGVGCEELSSGDEVSVPDASESDSREDMIWTVVVYTNNRS